MKTGSGSLLQWIGLVAFLLLTCLMQGTGSAQSYQFVTKWGSLPVFPSGVAVDASGNVYVADQDGNRIEKLSSTGTYISQWGTYGSGNGQFKGPFGVAVDASGNIYVADTSSGFCRGIRRLMKAVV